MRKNSHISEPPSDYVTHPFLFEVPVGVIFRHHGRFWSKLNDVEAVSVKIGIYGEVNFIDIDESNRSDVVAISIKDDPDLFDIDKVNEDEPPDDDSPYDPDDVPFDPWEAAENFYGSLRTDI